MVASGFGVVQSWSRIRGHRGCAQGGGGMWLWSCLESAFREPKRLAFQAVLRQG